MAPRIQDSYRRSYETPEEALNSAPSYLQVENIISTVERNDNTAYLFFRTQKGTIGLAFTGKHLFGWQYEWYKANNLSLDRVAKERLSSSITCGSAKSVCFGVTASPKVTGVTLDDHKATLIPLTDQQDSQIRLWYVFSKEKPINTNRLDFLYEDEKTTAESQKGER